MITMNDKMKTMFSIPDEAVQYSLLTNNISEIITQLVLSEIKKNKPDFLI